MTSWTIHLPPDRDGYISDAERFVAVKDGVRPFAIAFGPLWFATKRLWLGALGVLLIEGALFGLAWLLELPRPALGLLQALFHILVGLEASSVQRWTLQRKGWREIGAVSAHGRKEAELRAAALIVDEAMSAPSGDFGARGGIASLASIRPTGGPASSVLGLFPEARTR